MIKTIAFFKGLHYYSPCLFLFVCHDISYIWKKKPSIPTNKYTENDILRMLACLVDNIFVEFGDSRQPVFLWALTVHITLLHVHIVQTLFTGECFFVMRKNDWNRHYISFTVTTMNWLTAGLLASQVNRGLRSLYTSPIPDCDLLTECGFLWRVTLTMSTQSVLLLFGVEAIHDFWL